LAFAAVTFGIVVPAVGASADSGTTTTTTDPSAPMVAPAGSDLPSGFLDGVPVGNGTDVAPSGVTSKAVSSKASVTKRYVGDGVWTAIRSVAAAADRPCTVSTDDVVAMMVAPIFKESSAATTASSAGSPMTLSRADEWTTGRYVTTNNVDANYGLYEGRNPNTAYQRAYWHPGIGIWQYDSAGVGAPFTAAERMNVNVVGADVAKGMISRYCKSTGTTSFDKRRAAWSPWMDACTTSNASANLCEKEFQAMTSSSPKFANIATVAGISATGGAIKRTCSIDGQSVECWYIDPARAEGSKGWQFNPSGGPDWSTRPTPLALPFYVIKRNGYEERHWLKADTGYAVDISGKRLLGKNERPRSGTVNVGSGITWSRTSTLCDVTASRGNCSGTNTKPTTTTTATTTTTKPTTTTTTTPATPTAVAPVAPAGVRATATKVSGADYVPITLDINGDGRNDVFWYGPGAIADSIWLGKADGTFSNKAVNVAGTYEVSVGDVNGDGRDDILWYQAAGTGSVWLGKADGTFTNGGAFTRPAGATPLVLDRTGTGRSEILWYGPGGVADTWWTWNGRSFSATPASVSGTYTPIVGDFDGDGRDDIFWYAKGSGSSSVWLHTATGVRSIAQTVGNDYQPFVGDFDGDGRDDIVWYQPGTVTDAVWFGGAAGAFTKQSFVVNVDYQPVVADLQGDGRDDIIWYSTKGADHLWTRWSAARSRSSVALALPASYRPLGGVFGNQQRDGVFWYGPGALADTVWWT
jgi:hypothetical protein